MAFDLHLIELVPFLVAAAGFNITGYRLVDCKYWATPHATVV